MSWAPIPAPADPPAIIITGGALPAPAVELALDVRVIDRRELTYSPTRERGVSRPGAACPVPGRFTVGSLMSAMGRTQT